jgi:hypothetical protein
MLLVVTVLDMHLRKEKGTKDERKTNEGGTKAERKTDEFQRLLRREMSMDRDRREKLVKECNDHRRW